MTAYTEMLVAIEAANAEAIGELVDQTGLIPLVRPDRAEFQHHGGIWLADTTHGTARIRTLLTSPAGVEYVDAYLVAESVYPGDRDALHVILDDLVIRHGDELHELTVVTLTRGSHAAILCPVPLISDAFHVGPLTAFPGNNWCRSWSSWPFVTDSTGTELVAFGVPTT
jgi:hypothetical protein